MSNHTENLELFKYNTQNEEDLNSNFNLEKSLNENWDKIDEAIGGTIKDFNIISDNAFFNKFKNITFTSETFSFRQHNGRLGIDKPIKFADTINVYVASENYRIGIQYWKNENVGEDSFIYDTFWLSERRVTIPANQYFTLLIRRTDEKQITLEELKNISISRYVANENSAVFLENYKKINANNLSWIHGKITGNDSFSQEGDNAKKYISSQKFLALAGTTITINSDYDGIVTLYDCETGKMKKQLNGSIISIMYDCLAAVTISNNSPSLENNITLAEGNSDIVQLEGYVGKKDKLIDLIYNHTYNCTFNPNINRFSQSGTRIGLTKAIVFDCDIKLQAKTGYKLAIHTWNSLETYNPYINHFIKDTGWIGREYLIKRGTIFTFVFAKDDNTGIYLADFDNLSIVADNVTEIDNKVELLRYNSNINSVNHRGYCKIAPENTLSAYRLSKQNGFEKVETDVSFTSDGIAVLLHDSTIDRTSNGTGRINELTFEEVRSFDFGSWKSSDYVGEKIPSFEEFISLCKKIGLHPYVEIKSDFSYTEEQIQSLVDIVKKYGMIRKCSWISFSNTYLEYIKNYDNSARLGYVVNSISENVINTSVNLKTDSNEVFIDAIYSSVTDEKVLLCINNDLPLEVWTVDSGQIILELNPYITGVTSNNLRADMVLYDANK